jgi:hypothetical protein
MSITVALATSMPTSITVVATSTSSCPSRKARITASLSSPGIRPCRAHAAVGERAAVSSSCATVAALRSLFSDSSTSG